VEIFRLYRFFFDFWYGSEEDKGRRMLRTGIQISTGSQSRNLLVGNCQGENSFLRFCPYMTTHPLPGLLAAGDEDKLAASFLSIQDSE
jgi:hypothetical protein